MSEMQSDSTDATARSGKVPTVILFVGMAGSGKTTLLHSVYLQLKGIGKKVYLINLDPAVAHVPYSPRIDIRDTVDYKQAMKQYGLGPNGAILTSLNLFATRFDQVISLLEKKTQIDYVLIDTPGQIEVFTWSASGQIITEAMASSFPTIISYVADTPRSTRPATFMSNMLYACSVFYKTKLPLIIMFNKTDVTPSEFIDKWMSDIDAFQEEIKKDDTYMGSLVHSMSLVLEEFYSSLQHIAVSAVSMAGLGKLDDMFSKAREEYFTEFVPYLEMMKQKKKEEDEKHQASEFEKVMHDMKEDDSSISQEKKVSSQSSDKKSSSSSTASNEKSDEDEENEENKNTVTPEDELPVQYTGVRTREVIPSIRSAFDEDS
ncbi:putative GPN-loop GTPase 1 [Monocercomonoides exilis]|uniref:putative GPN-loop GTPase 1 n=1 Tax=Monocercomonoides exilis TaxID=2049356 RepID=UPI0035596C33|nr:putative GPN-loop GTPase 1 [Monocercomonoides exilis]|eukprot:MONOS_3404.1-p1 / transcript=MONOS_3404.1 / gene=MONOS_3404 / organism=Monocercomonoides_exilis_PA203 / gene_product=GPN-loop GTPase 1 homolog / transcript_product=GPN-loop GTPase 1 homolog / location=Mono_scaffold00080:37460-39188(-) / protein_length=375 / sequence_SO=supercontig / SO=protein_coding / is_pseudo=false